MKTLHCALKHLYWEQKLCNVCEELSNDTVLRDVCMQTYTALRGLSYSWHRFEKLCFIWLLQCVVLDKVGIQVLSRLSWVHQSAVPLSVDLPLHCNTIVPLDPVLFRFLKEVSQLMMCWVNTTTKQYIHKFIHLHIGEFYKIKMWNLSVLKLNSCNTQKSPVFFTTHSHLHLHQLLSWVCELNNFISFPI